MACPQQLYHLSSYGCHFCGWTIDFAKTAQVATRYYELIGVDPAMHLPTTKELVRLGLKDVAERLERLQSRKTRIRPSVFRSSGPPPKP